MQKQDKPQHQSPQQQRKHRSKTPIISQDKLLNFNMKIQEQSSEIDNLKQDIVKFYNQNEKLRQNYLQYKNNYKNQDLVQYSSEIVKKFAGNKEFIEEIEKSRHNPFYYSIEVDVNSLKSIEQLVYLKQTLQRVKMLYINQAEDYSSSIQQMQYEYDQNIKQVQYLQEQLLEYQQQLNFGKLPTNQNAEDDSQLTLKHQLEQEQLIKTQIQQSNQFENIVKKQKANQNIQLFVQVQTLKNQYNGYIQNIQQSFKLIEQSQQLRLTQLTSVDKLSAFLHDQINDALFKISMNNSDQMDMMTAKQLCQILISQLKKENQEIMQRHSDCFSWNDYETLGIDNLFKNKISQ